MALDRLDGMLAKVESVYGTDAAPIAADDGVLVNDRIWTPANPTHAFENTREDAASGTLFSLFPATPSGRIVEFEVSWEARGAGAAYSASILPEADALLQAGALARVDDFTGGTENVTYSPADSGHKSATVYLYAGGNLYKIVGVRTRFRIPITAGGRSTFVFACMGIMIAAPAVGALPSITYDTTIAPPSVNMSLDVGGGTWSPAAFRAELDGGQAMERSDSLNAAEGVESFDIVGFDPILTLNARTTALATYDPYADVRARTTRALAFQAGTVQYNKFDLAVVDAYVRDPSHSVDAGQVAWDLEYILQDYALKFN